MPNNGLSIISKPGDSSSDIARQWLVKFGEICQKEITSALAGIWAEQLGDIPADLLDRACDRLAKTWTSGFLPSPGNVRAQIENANSAGLELEAAGAWDRWLKHVTSYYHPDLGWDRRAPHLDAITEHAGSAAGGAHWVERCPEDELQWCRKRFLEDYTATRKTGEVQDLLTRGEAKKILASLMAEAPAKHLPPPAPIRRPDPGPSEPDRTAIGAFDDLREKLDTPVTPPHDAIPTESEWQARKARQLRAFTEARPTWREDHQRKIRLCVQLRAEGFPERRIAKQLFPGCPPKEQLRLLEKFANIYREEIEASAGAPIPSSASVGQESCCADSFTMRPLTAEEVTVK